MNRQEFLAYAAQKIPEHLRPLTQDHLRNFIDIGLMKEPLHVYDLAQVVQLLGMLDALRPRKEASAWPELTPELHQVVDCSFAEDPQAATVNALTTDTWLPPGDLCVNFTEQDYRVHLATERLKWANLVGRARKKASETGIHLSPEAVNQLRDTLMASALRFESGTTRLDITGFPRNSHLYNWIVLADGSLVPDTVGGDEARDYRYVHRFITKVPDGEVKVAELLLEIGLGGLTPDKFRGHQALMRRVLADPGAMLQVIGLPIIYSTFVTTWPDAIKLHDSVWSGEPSRYVVVRRFTGWIEYGYYTLAGEVASHLAGRTEISRCEHCGSVLGGRVRRNRRFCLKLENLDCYRDRDRTRKRAVAPLSG